MPFLVQIFAGGIRKRVDEDDLLLSVSSSKRRNNNDAASTITTTSASTACRKNNSQDAGRDHRYSGNVSGSSFEDCVSNNTSTNNHASTTVTNASIPSKPPSFHSKNTTFEERCNQLLRFKEEFGHCKVPNVYSDNPSLGNWCNSTRSAYRRTQQGLKSDRNLTPDRIKRLEEIGLEWYPDKASFDKRYDDLVAFKKEFGHCNVTRSGYKGISSLGDWCSAMRNAYRRKQNGDKIRVNLSQERIERLEEIGFRW